MTTHQSTLRRIAETCPTTPSLPEELVSVEARAQLLEWVLSSESVSPASLEDVRASSRQSIVVAVVGTAAATLIVGLIGTGILAHPVGPNASNQVGRHSITSLKATRNVAYVRTRLISALTAVNQIEHVQSTFQLGGSAVVIDDRWTSPDGNTMRDQTLLNGEREYDETMVTANGLTNSTVVDFPDRAWWTLSDPTPTGVCPPEQPCETGAEQGSLNPAQIQSEVRDGTLHFVASDQMIDGHETTEVSGSSAQASPAFGTFTLWIDDSTYLPVRSSNTNSEGHSTATSAFDWLAPTAANLAKLTVTVPPGFAHSPIPIAPTAPGDGVG